MYFFFEIALLPIVFIILGIGNQQERISASSFLLLYTLFGSIPFLLLLISRVKGGVSPFFPRKERVRRVFSLFLLLPFLFKLPLVGAHL